MCGCADKENILLVTLSISCHLRCVTHLYGWIMNEQSEG